MGFGSRKRANAGDDERAQPKKAKADLSNTTAKIDTNGDKYWEISKLRRVTISSFRGKTMVNIREYYEKDGQELPGKKGISLPMDQFTSFVALLPDLEVALKESGESVPRPDYSGVGGQVNEDLEGDEEESDEKAQDTRSKKNIEATSEEEESESEE